MIVVFALKRHSELLEANPFALLSIPLGLLNFADQSIVHVAHFLSVEGDIKKSTRGVCRRAKGLLFSFPFFAFAPLSCKVGVASV
jgi:hypothetical protein